MAYDDEKLQQVIADIAERFRDATKRLDNLAAIEPCNAGARLETAMEAVSILRNFNANVRVDLLLKYSGKDPCET